MKGRYDLLLIPIIPIFIF